MISRIHLFQFALYAFFLAALFGCTSDKLVIPNGNIFDTTSVKWNFDSPCSPPTSVKVVLAKSSYSQSIKFVTSSADAGPGTLRNLLALASAGDTLQIASTLSKDTLHLAQEIILSKSIVLDASSAQGFAINGGNAVRIFNLNSNVGLTLIGFQLVNGRAVKNGQEPGGAISTGNDCKLNLYHNKFFNNVADIGGAVRAGYGTLTIIEDCSFKDNDGSGANNGFSAGGVSTNGHGELIIRRCDFVNNRGNSGAAIYNLLQPITIEDCTIVGNVSNQDGAAIFTDEGNWVGPGAKKGGHIFVRRCWIEGNKSKAFGGACMLWANPLDTVMVENNVFKNNNVAKGGQWGDSKGGAIRGNGILTIRNCAFINNKSVAQGGALWLDGNGPVNIINSLFYGNEVVDDQGGAITLNTSGVVNILNCTFVKNHAGRACGAFWFGNPDLPITITNSLIAFNTAGQDHGQDQVGYQPKDGGGNLEFPTPKGGGRKVAEGSLVKDPLIDSLRQENGILVLPFLAESPAKDVLVSSKAPIDDMTQKKRDAQPDVGAWEFSSATTGIRCK